MASRSDEDWLLNVQRKLYSQSHDDLDYVFCKLWGLVTDSQNLRIALARVARNRGRNTPGVDGVTVRRVIARGVDAFLADLRTELRAGAYRPEPVRRVLIPKAGSPGKTRPLGIPTVKDRVVQAVLKNVLEPIFEADFYPCSYGFRPGRSAHGALEHLRILLCPRMNKAGDRQLSYQWVLEGDIKACFDGIDHHALMERVRKRSADGKVNRLITAFLKAGVMADWTFTRSEAGTPQGGILSPLLANIALSAIDERYERHAWPRQGRSVLTSEKDVAKRSVANRDNDHRAGRPVLVPIRYADDFLVLVKGPLGPGQYDQARTVAHEEKLALGTFLKEQLGLELSETKTLVSPVTTRMKFLGHHVCVRHHPTSGRLMSTVLIPRERTQRLRESIKRMFKVGTTNDTLEHRLELLNWLLRGWANFYRHAWGAKRVFSRVDHYVWWTIFRWLQKKHRGLGKRRLVRKYGRRVPGRSSILWGDGTKTQCRISRITVTRFMMRWQRPPDFAQSSSESPVRNERRTPGLEGGARKPAGVSPARRRAPT